MQHEPARRLLGQFGRRKLLRLAQKGTRTSQDLYDVRDAARFDSD